MLHQTISSTVYVTIPQRLFTAPMHSVDDRVWVGITRNLITSHTILRLAISWQFMQAQLVSVCTHSLFLCARESGCEISLSTHDLKLLLQIGVLRHCQKMARQECRHCTHSEKGLYYTLCNS